MSTISSVRPIQPARPLVRATAAKAPASKPAPSPAAKRPVAQPVKADTTPGFFQSHWRAVTVGAAAGVGALVGAAGTQIFAFDAAPSVASMLSTAGVFGLALGGLTLGACYAVPAAVGFFKQHWH